ncbi:aspartate-alanine antiporter [Uliginosibacterium sp. H3]|uniref:Aspartate-alanine antiporter n=1 Tax=Uliginosibacterium silvisoli TaxID=3114758 RepID=A0ABU6K3U2_9RHOO|nr:aspartate-alanine antiporter [Uliginosibacterium sp. H3]
MWTWFVELLKGHPDMALFLTLGLGFLIGKLRIGTFTLGSVTGVLIIGVLVGQTGVKISSDLKTVFFLLFLFAIGYKTGPQFFRGLKSSGLPQLALTTILCVTGLGASYAAAKILGFDAGTAAGLVAGAMTESATVGTATDAINHLPLDPAARELLLSNVAVAFAVTYFLGVVTVVVFLSKVGPKLMGVDLASACAELEREMGVINEEEGVTSAYHTVSMRAYRLPATFESKTVAELEALFAPRRVFIERVRRGKELLQAEPALMLQAGDGVAVSGRRDVLVAAAKTVEPEEIEDRELLDIPMLTLDVLVTQKAVIGKTIREARANTAIRSVFVPKIVRAGEELPLTLNTAIERGDVVTLSGSKDNVERVAARMGFADRPGSTTDVVPVMIALFLGSVIGIPAIAIGKLDIGLSQSVGVLLGGILFGWLRSVRPQLGQVPEAALWIFDSLGLTVFLAATGIMAGPDFVRGLKESGVSLVIAGILCAMLPHLVAILIGRYVMKMHPGVLLGVCAGAGTSAPGLAAVQEAARSKIPTLGYGASYAIGNVFLALWGSVMVLLTAG